MIVMSLGYYYKDKNGKLHYKSDKDIYIEGALYVFIGMIISLLCLFLK